MTKLPAIPIGSHSDSTLNFQTIQKLLGKLEKRHEVARGLVKLKWSGGTESATAKVAHGLKTQPIAVVATSVTAPAFTQIPIPNTTAYTPTEFEINAETKVAYNGEISVAWVAVA